FLINYGARGLLWGEGGAGDAGDAGEAGEAGEQVIVATLTLFLPPSLASFAQLIEPTGLTAGDRIPLVTRETWYSQIK
ncbi:MAG: hypothetical protein RLP02_39055, partial [Coleofasciculus sp. C2-GNP5-27]